MNKLLDEITNWFDNGYTNFKRDWIKNQCAKEDKHFVIPNTYQCSLCKKKSIKLKDGGYKW